MLNVKSTILDTIFMDVISGTLFLFEYLLNSPFRSCEIFLKLQDCNLRSLHVNKIGHNCVILNLLFDWGYFTSLYLQIAFCFKDDLHELHLIPILNFATF